MENKKLVLFDIDGTLIRHIGSGVANWARRYRVAAEEVYGVNLGEFPIKPVQGKVERQIAWMLLEPLGISRETFVQKFSIFADRVFDQLLDDPNDQALYHQISEAKQLVDLLRKNNDACLGVVSGNVQRVGEWKLAHAGYGGIFTFGVYGDDADDRMHLVKAVYEKANAFFHNSFGPDNTIIIGDTAHDVACARRIGARVIAVTTGGHSKDELIAIKPDLLVDSLMDARVLALLGLKKHG